MQAAPTPPEPLRRAAQLHDARRYGEVPPLCATVPATSPFGAAAANLSGMARFMLGEHEAAGRDFAEALRRNPGFTMAWLGVGNVAKEQGRLLDARNAYERALAAGIRSAPVHSNLGDVLCREGQAQDALPHYEAALRYAPNDPVARYKLGECLMLLGRFESALPAFRAAIQADPGFIKAYADLQSCALRLGRTDIVREACRACRQRDPDNQFSIAHLAFAHMLDGDEAGFDALYDLKRFPHPVTLDAPSGYADMAALNDAVERDVLAHPSLKWHHADHHRTTPRGFAYGILDAPTPAITALADAIRGAVQDYIDALEPQPGHPFLGARPAAFELKMWATVLARGGEHQPHSHEESWLSGVYYARTGFMADDPSHPQAGWIRFGGFTDYTEDPRFLARVRTVEPREGTLFLFPSYFLHQSVPFQVEGRRISVAFDVQPRPAR